MRCRSLSYQLQCSNSTHGRGGEDIGIDRRNWFGSGVKLGVNYWSLGRRQEKACASTPQNRRFLMTHAVDGASWINSTVATLLCGVAFRSQPGALRVLRRFVWNLTARIHRSGARWGLWATRQSELSTNPRGGVLCQGGLQDGCGH